MDFYLPFKAHRDSWRGKGGYWVAALFDPNAEFLSAYNSEGEMIALRLSDGVPRLPLLIFHPAEPKFERVRTRGNNVASTIEPCDPTLKRALVSGSNPATSTDCSGGGGGSTPTPGIYITGFYSYRGDGWWGSLEMQFESEGWSGGFPYWNDTGTNGSWVYPTSSCSKGIASANLEPEQSYTNLMILLSSNIVDVSTVTCPSGGIPTGYGVTVKEIDGGLNGNFDDFGRRFYRQYSGFGMPWNATVGNFFEFYSCYANAIPAPPGYECVPEQSVSLRLEYR